MGCLPLHGSPCKIIGIHRQFSFINFIPQIDILFIMIYISDKQQQKIKNKIAKLPLFLKKEYLAVVLFQILGTLIFTYGTCVGRYKHPINQRHINPAFQFLNGCLFYFALSISVPFSGGHLNPAVSISINIFRKNKYLFKEIIGQFIGAMLGATIAYGFFGVIPYYYWQNVDFGSLVLDTIGQAFGSFLFVFFMLIITETNYMAGEYFRYFLLAIMLVSSRAFTLRKNCLNPILGITFQFYAAIEKGNFMLFLYSLTLIIGPILGGFLAVKFFKNFYAPLKQGLALQKGMNTINEPEDEMG